MLKLTPVENGWLLEDDDPVDGRKWIVENKSEPYDFMEVLRHIQTHFGYHGVSRDDRRIFVEVRKGDGTELKE